MQFKPQFIQAFIDMYEERNTKIANQPGCLSLTLLQDIDDPSIFFTYSHWSSTDYLEQYRHSALFEETWRLTKQMFAQPAQAWTTISLKQSKKRWK